MSEQLSWAFFALSVLFLYLVYGLLRFYLQLRVRSKQRELLHKERLTAIAKIQPPPAADPSELGGRESLLVRLAGSPPLKVISFFGVALLTSGFGVCAGLWLLPEYYVLHDFWSLGLIGVAFGLGLIIYVLCYRQLTREVINQRKLA